MRFFLYKFILYAVIFSGNLFADVINKVEVIGNNRITYSTILEIIDFQKSTNYSEQNLNSFQKKLYETNFFSSVNLILKNNTLEISVIENPLIEFFIIKGVTNEQIEDLIYEKISLGQNKIFSNFLLNQDISTIRSIYNDAGFYSADILPEVSKLSNGNVNIVLNISKNQNYKIKRIFFIGDKHFKSSTLSDVVSSSEHGWWKFLSQSSTINMNRIEFDKRLLKNFYLNDGFYDVQILSSDIELLDSGYASITYSINSGKRYNFLNFEIVDEGKNLNKKDLETISKIVNNEIKGEFSLKKINNIKEKIYTYLNQKKIEFLRFDILENKLNNNISIKIVFNKTVRSFVNQINISGNSITEEEVVRRELFFSEGDSFSKFKLDKSIDNLKASGIFKDVKPEIKNIGNESVDVEIQLEEQPTGSISAGVGIGTAGSEISTGIAETNLFGKGVRISSNISLGTEKFKGNIATTIPDFNNTNNDFTYNFYAISTDFKNAGYESSVLGNDVYLTYDLFEDITIKPGVGIETDKIDTNASASELYRSREGDYLTFKTSYRVVTDKRNKRFQTTRGYKINFGQTLATPGSDIPYLENNISGSYYYPLNENYILSFKSGFNAINALDNKDVKLSDRKFLSNKTLRGFENYGVGPKDGNDHIGGNYSAYTNLSSTIPNPLPEKWNANSIIFLDAGNVWGVDYNDSRDSNKIRSSAGIGLDWVSPVGPLSFIFAQTLSSADGDLEESFSFQIGSSF